MTKEQRNEQRREYEARPEVKARKKAYYARPEVKQRRAEHHKAYRSRPEVKAKRRAQNLAKDPAVAQGYRKQYYTDHRPQLKEREYARMHTLAGRLRALVRGSRASLQVRGRAKRNLEHSITYEDLMALYEQQEGKCALTGRSMTTITKDPDVISLDRIDNDKGYTRDNIQLVTGQVNRCKNAYTVEEFIDMCRAVVNNKG